MCGVVCTPARRLYPEWTGRRGRCDLVEVLLHVHGGYDAVTGGGLLIGVGVSRRHERLPVGPHQHSPLDREAQTMRSTLSTADGLEHTPTHRRPTSYLSSG